MKKILKWVGIALGSLLLLGLAAGIVLHEPRPKGKPGPDADALARRMLAAINKPAWDSTRYMRWSFPPGHHHVWDKFQERASVRWSDKEVLLSTATGKGRAWQDGVELEGAAADALAEKAWFYFCNDSFWLNAPAKAFDPGTSRSLVQLDNGDTALLVAYQSGGVTPGDAYLWMLDENGLPKSWKMWVSIIPVGGVEISWENWIALPTGAKVATRHGGTFYDMEITDIKVGGNLQSIGLEKTFFQANAR